MLTKNLEYLYNINTLCNQKVHKMSFIIHYNSSKYLFIRTKKFSFFIIIKELILPIGEVVASQILKAFHFNVPNSYTR